MLQLSLLGQVRISLDGEAVSGFVSSKAQALLCYLAMTLQGASRDTLIGLLWDELPEPDAKANLRVTLSNLRKLVGDHLEADRQWVQFNRSLPYRLDTETFEGALAGGASLSALTEAAELYRGDFMAGFYLRDVPLYSDWQANERERLQRVALEIFDVLTQRLVARAEFPRAIHYASRLLALEPWREASHRELMRLYARTDNYTAALKQFETCRELLETELGVEPSAETEELNERIKSARNRPRPIFPLQSSPLVGRVRELTLIADYLTTAECRLLTLAGPGGVGKTRLALEAAHRQTSGFLEGVYFVPLAAATTVDAFLAAVASSLSFQFEGAKKPAEQLLAFLRGKEVLLVLDNFEQLVEAGTDFLIWLLEETSVKLLITSRERLKLRSEWILALEGLPYPASALEASDDYDAVRLFLQTALRVSGGLRANTRDKAAVARLCRLLEGLPLALELAAAWVWQRPVEDIATAIEGGIELLTTDARDVPERQRSIRAVFEHSWHLLTQEERWTLSRLAVFAGGFTAQAASQVVGTTMPVLSSLVDKFLLQCSANDHYEQHSLLHQYAREKLAEHPKETAAIEARHAGYFLAFAEEAEQKLAGEQQRAGLESLETEHDNLRAALDWSLRSELATGLRIAGALWQFWRMRGYLAEGRRWYEALLAHPAALPSQERAKALAGAGTLAFYQGDYESSHSYHSEALAIRSQLGLKEAAARSRYNLGSLAAIKGDDLTAKAYFEEGIATFREMGNHWAVAYSLTNLGNITAKLGQADEAVAMFEESLQLGHQLGDQQIIVQALYHLGSAKLLQGEERTAEHLLKESLTLSHSLAFEHGIANALEGLAQLAAHLNDAPRAARLWGAAEALRDTLGTPLTPDQEPEYEQEIATVRTWLGEADFEVIWREGREMPLEAVVSFALDA